MNPTAAMQRRTQAHMAAIRELAQRPQGVDLLDVASARSCSPANAKRLLAEASEHLGLCRTRSPHARGAPYRYFDDQAALSAWLRAQLAPPAGRAEPVERIAAIAALPPSPSLRSRVDLASSQSTSGVPGWSSSPPIRAGALDFKRHQRDGRY